MMMERFEIEIYKNKIIVVNINHGTHEQLRYGLPLFGDTGIILYNGYEKPFCGFYDNHYSFVELMQEDNEIPYEKIVCVSCRNNRGVLVEEHLKNSFAQDLNNINRLQNTRSEFKYNGVVYSNLYISQQDNSGMIYNPYSDRWSYL
jgi:hypothetical protein